MTNAAVPGISQHRCQLSFFSTHFAQTKSSTVEPSSGAILPTVLSFFSLLVLLPATLLLLPATILTTAMCHVAPKARPLRSPPCLELVMWHGGLRTCTVGAIWCQRSDSGVVFPPSLEILPPFFCSPSANVGPFINGPAISQTQSLMTAARVSNSEQLVVSDSCPAVPFCAAWTSLS